MYTGVREAHSLFSTVHTAYTHVHLHDGVISSSELDSTVRSWHTVTKTPAWVYGTNEARCAQRCRARDLCAATLVCAHTVCCRDHDHAPTDDHHLAVTRMSQSAPRRKRAERAAHKIESEMRSPPPTPRGRLSPLLSP